MTKEEFIDLAKQSTDRVDLLNKMGYSYSIPNIQQYIRDQRTSLGISVEEMFACFLPPPISKETYLEYVATSSSKKEFLKKMGKPNNGENNMKYILDIGKKYGFTFEEIDKFFEKN